MTLPSIADITVRLTLSGSLPARSVCHRINSETASDRIDDTAHKIGELGKEWGADLTPKEAGLLSGQYLKMRYDKETAQNHTFRKLRKATVFNGKRRLVLA